MLGHTAQIASASLAAEQSQNPLLGLWPFILIIAVFYFFLMRPQRNRQRQMMEMQRSLLPGQQVMTSAGLIATIVAVEDDVVVLEMAPGVHGRFVKRAVVEVLTPVEESTADTDESDLPDPQK